MFDVLVVEDEPAARRYVRTVVDEHCPGFRVVAEAEHGQHALEYLEEHRVDLVITDARMPVVDGIGLIRAARERGYEFPILVLSGHDDFEYVRGALTGGAVDYVLKPAGVVRMRTVLENLAVKIEERRATAVAREVARAIVGDKDAAPPAAPFPEESYIAVIRAGGLVPRLAAPRAPAGETEEAHRGVIVVGGRDRRELFIVGNAGRESDLDTSRFRAAVAAIEGDAARRPGMSESTPCVRAVWPRSVDRVGAGAAIRALVAAADAAIRPGWSGEVSPSGEQPEAGRLDAPLRRQITYAVEAQNPRLLSSLVADLATRWEEAGAPLVRVRADLDEFLRIATGEAQNGAIDDLLTAPQSYRAIADGVLEILRIDESELDLPPKFREIRAWVDQHIRDEVSVATVADHFGLSTDYVGKLFRRHQGEPLAEHVNRLRVNLARSLIRSDPTLSIKEVAGACGFRDQFYFSRVFRAQEGISPSEFRESPGNTG